MKLLITIMLLATITPAHAAMTVPFSPTNATSYVPSTTGGSANIGAQFFGKGAANDPLHAFRRVPISASSLRQAAKHTAKFPWTPMGLAMLAAGLAFDYALNEWANPNPDGGFFDTGTCYRFGISYTESYDQCLAGFEAQQPQYTWTYGVVAGQNTQTPRYDINRNGVGSGYWWKSSQSADPQYYPYPDPESNYPGSQPATDADYDAAWDTLSDAQKLATLADPATGLVQPLPELITTADDLTADYDAANDADPNTNPTTDGYLDTGTATIGETAIDETTATPESTTSQCVDYPNTLGCWTSGDELTPDNIGTNSVDVVYSPVSVSSNETCPADPTFSIKGQAYSISMQPTCDLATSTKPIFIAICTLIGAYILVGAVRE